MEREKIYIWRERDMGEREREREMRESGREGEK